MIGKKFGKWKVLEIASSRRFNTYWLCICECGLKKDVAQYSLKNGSSASCGCEFKYAAKRNGIEERRKEIRKQLKKGYSYRDIMANIYTSFRTITQENKKLRSG